MVRLTRRARRDPVAQPRTPAIDDRTQRLWRSFKGGIIGQKGEVVVAKRLAELGLAALHDVLLPVDGGITQIDHIVQCPAGIVVIETKAWSGEITGAADDVNWRQRLDSGRVETSIINPIRQNRQNRQHVRAVRSLLSGQNVQVTITSHVVLTGGAELPAHLADQLLDLRRPEELARPSLPPASALASLHLAWSLLVGAGNKSEALRPAHEAAIADKTLR